jgi:hypothetical protein
VHIGQKKPDRERPVVSDKEQQVHDLVLADVHCTALLSSQLHGRQESSTVAGNQCNDDANENRW